MKSTQLLLNPLYRIEKSTPPELNEIGTVLSLEAILAETPAWPKVYNVSYCASEMLIVYDFI